MIPLPPEEVGSQIESKSQQQSVATVSSPWQYDDTVTACSKCKSDFNAFNRKHHCRLCGKIFCGDCSDQKALIPPSSIVLTPIGGKKAKPRSALQDSLSVDDDPDRMLTYLAADNKEMLYGKGLEERFKLAREPLRVCASCYDQLAPLQEDLRNSNSNAMRFNFIDPTDPRRLFNSPLAFTLGHEIRKAAYTLNNLLPLPKRMGAFIPAQQPYKPPSSTLQDCKSGCRGANLSHLDGVRIPAKLLERAVGIAVLTVIKGGFGLVGGELGTGLVVARRPNGQWSPPSAIGTAGLAWGALLGAQVSDHVFLLMNTAAVQVLFDDNGSVQLGADVGVALGPLGRAFEGNLGAGNGNLAPIYTYSLSKGLYAGVSLDGKVVQTRRDVNERFYGQAVTAQEILHGRVPTPPAAQPLYAALQRCHVYASNEERKQIPLSLSQHNLNHEEELVFEPERMPPAVGDQHSYAGLSDITYDPGY